MSSIPNDPGAGFGEPGAAGRTTTDRVADRAHRTIDDAADSVNEAEREIRRRVKSSEEQLVAAVDENVEKVRTYIEQNPIASAGIAFVAGLVISSLLRR